MRQPSGLQLASIVAAVTCAACASAGQTARSPLSSGDWRLLEINGVAAIPNEIDRRPSIRFTTDSARVTGNGGCNSYGGDAAFNGSSVRVSRLISTKRACNDAALNQQETRLFSVLETVDRYSVSADTLKLFHGSGVALRFVR